VIQINPARVSQRYALLQTVTKKPPFRNAYRHGLQQSPTSITANQTFFTHVKTRLIRLHGFFHKIAAISRAYLRGVNNASQIDFYSFSKCNEAM